jgi:GTPase involved in cell partitioning and DNA repair
MSESRAKEKHKLQAIARSAMVCCYMGGTQDAIEDLEKELSAYDPEWSQKTKSVVEQAKAEQRRQEEAEEKKAAEAKKTEIVKGVEDEKI